MDERKKADKRAQDVEGELATLLAEELVGELSASTQAVFKKHVHRIDDSNNVLGFLSSVCLLFSGKVKDRADSQKSYLLVLSSSPFAPSQAATNVIVVFGSEDELVKQTGESLKSKLGAKGGGKAPRWSGKTIGVWKESTNAIIDHFLADT